MPQPDFWDEQSALSAARALSADIALYGEVRRTAGELSIQPRLLELKGDEAARAALDPVPVPEGKLIERLRTLPVAYLRALKVPATDAGAGARAEVRRPHRLRPRLRGLHQGPDRRR